MKPQITIHQVDPHGPSITVALGDGFAVPTIAGGWGDTARPRDRSIAEWAGSPLMTLDVPVLVDGFDQEISVEPQLNILYGYMRNMVGPRDEPPVLQITGVPIPFTSADWVLNAITPADEIRRQRDGKRIRASMSLQFLEYRQGDVVVSRRTSPAKKQQQKSKGDTWKSIAVATSTRVYNVKKGDTLQSIAAHELGSTARWHEIAKLNNIRDPASIKPGQRLKIPKQ